MQPELTRFFFLVSFCIYIVKQANKLYLHFLTFYGIIPHDNKMHGIDFGLDFELRNLEVVFTL